MSIPTILSPTTTMSTTENIASETWTTATTTSETMATTPREATATITSETMATTPSDSETIATTTPSADMDGASTMLSSRTTNPPVSESPGDGTTTVNSVTITQTDATSEAKNIASKTVGI